MKPMSVRSRRAIAASVLGAVAFGATTAVPLSAGVASASPVIGTDKTGTYLALGDSVAFGFVTSEVLPAPNYLDAHSFVGYPEDVAQQLGVHVVNAGCPGETSASMLDVTALSNGCENQDNGSPGGYRTQFPLHVQYQGTQMAYALSYLTDHHNTRLVSIDIGANDFFVCQDTTPDQCTSPAELQSVAEAIAHNLSIIYTEVRSVYQGPIVALTYYSLSYSDPNQIAGAEFLDGVIADVTTAFGGLVADGFTAFQGPSLASGGDPCAAGLLRELPDGTCDIHPSPLGHELLAQAIEDVLPPGSI